MMGDAVGRELIERFNLFVNLMIPAGHRRRKLSNAEMAHYRSALGTPARREASAIFPRAITRSRAFLAQVETNLHTLDRLPALTVWGDADFAFRAKERIRWEGLLHDRSTVVIHGAGHFVQPDAPDDFAEAISTWHAMQVRKGQLMSDPPFSGWPQTAIEFFEAWSWTTARPSGSTTRTCTSRTSRPRCWHSWAS